MNGFETGEKGECRTQMGEGHNTIWKGLALNFKTQQ